MGEANWTEKCESRRSCVYWPVVRIYPWFSTYNNTPLYSSAFSTAAADEMETPKAKYSWRNFKTNDGSTKRQKVIFMKLLWYYQNLKSSTELLQSFSVIS